MERILLVLLMGTAFCAIVKRDTTCTNSYSCPSTAKCCRDSNGNTVTDQHMGGFGPPILSSQSGVCTNVLGGEGAICDSSCGCQPGYECYRPMSGVCCPPMKCYNATWVEQQKKYWANCRPPTCFFPP